MPLTANRDRVVLAMLLMNAGRTVSAATLIEAVWGEDPPPTVRTQVQTCVSRLRGSLPSGTIHTTPQGYRLEVGPEHLDLLRWNSLLTAARATANPGERAGLLRRALDLWQGPAATGVDSDLVQVLAASLDDQHATTVEAWAGLRIADGEAAEVLEDLSAAVARHPLRETLRERLIAALHATGRMADALAEYRRFRSLLREELGVEPGAELQEAHRRILVGDPPPVRRPSRPRPAARSRQWTAKRSTHRHRHGRYSATATSCTVTWLILASGWLMLRARVSPVSAGLAAPGRTGGS